MFYLLYYELKKSNIFDILSTHIFERSKKILIWREKIYK